MSRIVKSTTVVMLGLVTLIFAGCSKPGSLDAQAISAYRTKLTLADEPEGVQTVADVRLTLVGHTDSHDDHDHDGDGKPDHAPGDHDAEDHDAEKADADKAEHEAEGHDEDGDDHADHEHAQGDLDARSAEKHVEHDHDGDGKPDHAATDHDSDHHHAEGHDEHGHEDDTHEHAHESESQDVVMVGHIGGLANPWAKVYPDYPFQKTEAIFFLADPQAVIENEEAGHKHAPGEECAFCAAHAADKADMLAMVRFVDEKGKVLRTDARQLFDVKEQDTVVVSGTARVTSGGILVVDARGIYVRK